MDEIFNEVNHIEDKTFFNPGDLVQLRQDLPNKPVMMVVCKETSIFKHDKDRLAKAKPILIGIRCRWFDTNNDLQEAVFSTKDLILV